MKHLSPPSFSLSLIFVSLLLSPLLTSPSHFPLLSHPLSLLSFFHSFYFFIFSLPHFPYNFVFLSFFLSTSSSISSSLSLSFHSPAPTFSLLPMPLPPPSLIFLSLSSPLSLLSIFLPYSPYNCVIYLSLSFLSFPCSHFLSSSVSPPPSLPKSLFFFLVVTQFYNLCSSLSFFF